MGLNLWGSIDGGGGKGDVRNRPSQLVGFILSPFLGAYTKERFGGDSPRLPYNFMELLACLLPLSGAGGAVSTVAGRWQQDPQLFDPVWSLRSVEEEASILVSRKHLCTH